MIEWPVCITFTFNSTTAQGGYVVRLAKRVYYKDGTKVYNNSASTVGIAGLYRKGMLLALDMQRSAFSRFRKMSM
mgnify:CR=1 FL=1